METLKKHTRVKARERVVRETCCEHCAEGHHGRDHGGNEGRGGLLWVGLGAGFFVLALIVGRVVPDLPGGLILGGFFIAYVLVGGEVLLRAGKNIRSGQVFDENFLMAVASLGAFCIGEYPEGVAVMLFYQVGEAFQDLAVNRSRASISSLMDIRPDYANMRRGDGWERVGPGEVHPGDLILVKPGEKIPLDGVVTEGFSALDCSALTGESLPRDAEPGSEVLSGSINKTSALTIKVTKEFGESTAAKILELVQNAGSKKAPVENFITRFARYYTPVVVFAALALALIPPLFITLTGGAAANVAPGAFAAAFMAVFPSWVHRALVFLVVSCPCALVISVPLSFFGGIGGASRKGILVKGGNYLEALNQVDTVIFDKTGTLTKGRFKVTKIVNAPQITQEELLRYAAAAERFSNHPIALSIQQAAAARGINVDQRANSAGISEEIPGRGLRLTLEGKTILAGNARLLAEYHIPCPVIEAPGTVVYVACDGLYAGHLEITDEPKGDAAGAVKRLKAMGIRSILMFTGDNGQTGKAVAETLGLDGFYGDLLPQDKVAQLETLFEGRKSGQKIVFVGDGINDAPVLARSDIGVAMGGAGQDAAIEAADIVLMTDEPSRLADALTIARKTHRIVWQNIVFALAVKGVILVLGALGLVSMWVAVFGDVGVAFIAILNALRAQYSA